jgi:SAM-dependent methyltransferase
VPETIYGDDLAFVHDAGFAEFASQSAPGVLARVRGRGVVVELGCGSGGLARALVDAGHEVVGVDASAALLALARERVPEARFEHSSMHDAELPACDAVVAIGEAVAYGPADLARSFERWRAALRPGGVLLFDAPLIDRQGAGPPRLSLRQGDGWLIVSEQSREGRTLTRRIVTFRDDGSGCWRRADELHELRLYERDELPAMLRGAGFASVESLSGGYTPGQRWFAGLLAIEARHRR